MIRVSGVPGSCDNAARRRVGRAPRTRADPKETPQGLYQVVIYLTPGPLRFRAVG
ncbi:hypothetical protein QFZ75_000496 [Streptomyces sp. V3I8]|nr:hypothetical protein [Streptomyces sp. V3I8]